MFIGREGELAEFEALYRKDKFQMFVLYGRRRIGKTTCLKEFCRTNRVYSIPRSKAMRS